MLGIALYADTVLLGTIESEAYVFQLDHGKWWMDRLVVPGVQQGSFNEVSVYEDVALIGASPHAYVFRFDGVAWKREAILEPPELGNRNCSCLPIPSGDPVRCDDGTPNFGVSVALDGELALVGANLDDVTGTDSGAAYLYRYDGAHWNYEALLQGDSVPACGAGFGRLVALHDRRALVRQGQSAYFFRIR